MPELPEVETVRRAMEAHLVGRRITAVAVSGLPLRQPLPVKRLRSLVGARFCGARRRGKYLLLALEDGRCLLVHLGMSGNLLLRPSQGKHDHLVLALDQGPPLVYADPRRFGLVRVLTASELETCPELDRLGVEPLEAAFDVGYLQRCCRGRRLPIKSLLMDSRLVAGLGNIYAAEALFRAGIRPTTPAGRLGRKRLVRLAQQVKAVLQEAVEAGGTTISDYLGRGDGGRFQQRLAVYGRAGERCLVCEGPVDALVQAGRTTYYCRRCQR
ncbi:MAG: bifunctional DNA-formamidopyrimidine glycosylase/DNA-(apurinic or apyrimidinic site) lyase [Candidatus Latescibacterota bacterium]